MCEAAVYVRRDAGEELFLESLEALEVKGESVEMTDIFGEQEKLKARVKILSLVDHRILLEPME
jgi:predicted RNA-binding protein